MVSEKEGFNPSSLPFLLLVQSFSTEVRSTTRTQVNETTEVVVDTISPVISVCHQYTTRSSIGYLYFTQKTIEAIELRFHKTFPELFL